LGGDVTANRLVNIGALLIVCGAFVAAAGLGVQIIIEPDTLNISLMPVRIGLSAVIPGFLVALIGVIWEEM
jgi:hypothetical protein